MVCAGLYGHIERLTLAAGDGLETVTLFGLRRLLVEERPGAFVLPRTS